MTENLIEVGDDNALGTALRAEVPARSDNYWTAINDRLSTVPASAVATTEVDRDESLDITAHAEDSTATSFLATAGTRLRSWPVLAVAAALVLVAVLVTVRLLPANGEQVDVGFADDEVQVVLESLPGPTQNVDHWHAVYGIWDCTADGGEGAWLPAFQSTEDDVGIHSHGDGLIYIHPFFEESAGRNATFSHFADSMNFTLTDDQITLEDGSALVEGVLCGGEPAELQMLRWQDARSLEADPSLTPRVITSDFGAQRFYNDLEVWTVALAPAGSAIPLPPQERFDQPWVVPNDIEFNPSAQTPTQGDADVYEFPPFDSYVNVGLVAIGTDVDPIIEEGLSDRLPSAGFLVSGSGKHLVATASQVRIEVEFFTYLVSDDAASRDPASACVDVRTLSTACTRIGGSDLEGPMVGGTFDRHLQTVFLWDAPADARWLSVQVDNGHIVLADVVQGTSWAAWRTGRGDWASVELLDIDHNVIWSDTND